MDTWLQQYFMQLAGTDPNIAEFIEYCRRKIRESATDNDVTEWEETITSYTNDSGIQLNFGGKKNKYRKTYRKKQNKRKSRRKI
jgi:hypothetical protein